MVRTYDTILLYRRVVVLSLLGSKRCADRRQRKDDHKRERYHTRYHNTTLSAILLVMLVTYRCHDEK